MVNGLLEHQDIHAIFLSDPNLWPNMFIKQLLPMGSGSKRWLVQKTIPSLCRMQILIKAVKEIISAAYGSAGERCMACSVVWQWEMWQINWLKNSKKKQMKLIFGNGLEQEVFLGPVIRLNIKKEQLNILKSDKKRV